MDDSDTMATMGDVRKLINEFANNVTKGANPDPEDDGGFVGHYDVDHAKFPLPETTDPKCICAFRGIGVIPNPDCPQSHPPEPKEKPGEAVLILRPSNEETDDAFREAIEQAHMAGQHCSAGVDPSYSDARAYFDENFPVPPKNDILSIQKEKLANLP